MKQGVLILLIGAALAGCGDKPAEKKGAPPTLISTTRVERGPLEVVERTLGTLEAVKDPKVGAEVAGRVIEVAVRAGQSVRKGQLLARLDPTDIGHQASADQAEIARLQALLAQQERLVARQNELVQKNFISKNALEDATAQRTALKEQLAAATARAAISSNGVNKTRVVAPFDGEIEVQIVAPGDYVKVGDPVVLMISNQRLRAHLPFPESAAPRLKLGQEVKLTSPLAPDQPVLAKIEDFRPTLSEGSRAIDVIARLDNPGYLRGGASVDASVVTGRRDDAILVPEQAVVLRPAGRVVYIVADGKARQQKVDTGNRQGGRIEITAGLSGGETLALDGAGFLSDGAAVAVKTAPAAKPAPAAAPADSAAKSADAPAPAKP